jgi:hypothetical protein
MNDRLWPRWMDTATAAEYICRERGTLENWRYAKDPEGPPWFPGKGGKPTYDRIKLDAWMEGMEKAAS